MLQPSPRCSRCGLQRHSHMRRPRRRGAGADLAARKRARQARLPVVGKPAGMPIVVRGAPRLAAPSAVWAPAVREMQRHRRHHTQLSHSVGQELRQSQPPVRSSAGTLLSTRAEMQCQHTGARLMDQGSEALSSCRLSPVGKVLSLLVQLRQACQSSNAHTDLHLALPCCSPRRAALAAAFNDIPI